MSNDNKKENYSAIVTANALQTSTTGTNSVAIQVQTIANLATGEEIERTFVGNLYLSPRAVENAITTLREVFGYQSKSFFPLNDTTCLMGRKCEVTVEYEEYNGESRPKVKWFNKEGSFAARKIKPVTDDVARSIAAQYDCYFQEESKRPNPYSRSASSTMTPAGDDDLPF